MMPTALIVEDEPEANRLLAMLVQLRGYRTESAFTGGEALAIARDRPPDVVFLDLMLPDTSGYDVCRALKDGRATCQIPVVMVTARLADENRAKSAQVGANDFIPKPYTPDQIFGALVAADRWRQSLERLDDRGEIALGDEPDARTRERLQQLRSRLLARTPLPADAVDRIARSLDDLARLAADWGQRRGVPRVATLRFALEPDHVALTVQDLGGWFAGSQRSGAERLAAIVERGGFDRADEDHVQGSITLIKDYPDPSA